jgi:hypothetical protein
MLSALGLGCSSGHSNNGSDADPATDVAVASGNCGAQGNGVACNACAQESCCAEEEACASDSNCVACVVANLCSSSTASGTRGLAFQACLQNHCWSNLRE